MIESIEIIRVTIKHGAGLPTSEYAQLLYKGKEVGFINETGIFLKMWNPVIKTGVYMNLGIFEEKTFSQKCNLVKKHWPALYDRYETVFRN